MQNTSKTAFCCAFPYGALYKQTHTPRITIDNVVQYMHHSTSTSQQIKPPDYTGKHGSPGYRAMLLCAYELCYYILTFTSGSTNIVIVVPTNTATLPGGAVWRGHPGRGGGGNWIEESPSTLLKQCVVVEE